MLNEASAIVCCPQINTQHSTLNIFYIMKKLFTLLICVCSLLLSFSSCSEEAFDVDSVNKQTIFVFYPWTGNLTASLQANVDSMRAGIVAKKGLNNTRVLVFFSNSLNKSTLYDLQYDENAKSVACVALKEYEGQPYQTADGLASIINEVKEQAEALNYAMIIGCHGCGWTYADDWVSYPYFARPSNGSASTWQTTYSSENFSGLQFGEDPEHPKTRFFGNVDKKEAAIDVTTLAEALEKSNTKMQYILFDACYMGNVETAYELRNVTNFMIASSSEIMTLGLPYKTIWSSLNGTSPSYSSIVSSTVNFYTQQKVDPCCNLAAIDCRQLDKLASIMKEINSQYKLSSTVPLDSIQPLGGFSPHLFYDLGVYVDSLKPAGYLKDQFTTQLKATVKAAQTTDSVYTVFKKPNHFAVKTYSGLSISDFSTHSVAVKGREKTAWWKATH